MEKILSQVVIPEGAKNGITEVVFILDKSGSMGGMENDTIKGYNSMLEEQKSAEGSAYISTVLFSTSVTVLHDRVDVKEVEPLTRKDYRVGGGTALLDAIGEGIRHIAKVHKYIRPEDVPEHTIFVITTDGEENASRIYSSDDVKGLIKTCEAKGWEFLFLADNIDAVETAERIGIRQDRSASYSVPCDTGAMFKSMSHTLKLYRKSGTVRDNWSEDISKRHKK